ncbi:MAG TPA: M1 family aminopeptidase [Bryobacteraceae bacterium]|nr:M1 family aminopeptidase [Bryobacteraceae bacterium]
MFFSKSLMAVATVWIAPALAAPTARSYSVDHYEVRIAPDLDKQRIAGEVAIRYRSRAASLDAVELDAGPAVEIAEVLDGRTRLRFDRRGGLLSVALAVPAIEGVPRALTIRYRAGPGKGLKFFPDQVYSEFFTSDWMVCNDRPDGRATLRLRIAARKGWRVAASGEAAGNGAWRIDTPLPPFLYGFAAGRFQETGDGRLRVLGSADAMPQAQAILDATRAALRFFAARTGKDYPAPLYTQVFTHGGPMQENAGLTLLPEAYGASLRAQPEDLWLLAHELAHQWYAVGIPCQDRSDFWLNEGISTFLADAFLESRFGRQRYEREIERSRAIYERLRGEGKDRALSFHAWNSAQEAGGQIPYHKGAYALDLLRREMGDASFWRGLKICTGDNWNKPVTSRDFQAAMETAAGKSLAAFFDRWVYAP